jgi:dimeric dUTPase (all-alpha-NTP-PPase superfamily)
MDKLDIIFIYQLQLQYKLKTMPFKNQKKRQEYINIMSLALIDEIMEALRETKYKPWKKQQQFNKEKFREELIDAWHFLINLTLASGMDTNDLYEAFVKKNKINIERNKKGY